MRFLRGLFTVQGWRNAWAALKQIVHQFFTRPDDH